MSEHSVDIASPANPRIREAVALRDRRSRERTGQILIEGVRELGRALDAGIELVTLFVCQPLIRTAEARVVADRLREDDPRLVRVSEPAFAKLVFGDRSEGVVGVALRPATSLARLTLSPDPLIAVLDGIEKPGNLGAIVRSADGAGADAVVAADPRTDLFNPNAIRASLGTIFDVPLAGGSADEVRGWLRTNDLRIVTARVDGPTVYTEADLTGRVAIVVGSEATGLADAWSGSDVTEVRLPMLGAGDSLNASVATAVLLYEARRQRGNP